MYYWLVLYCLLSSSQQQKAVKLAGRVTLKKPSFYTVEVDKKYIFPAGARHTTSRFTYNAVNIRSAGFLFNYLCTYDLYSHVHNVLDACINAV
jgi:hypothetical protein